MASQFCLDKTLVKVDPTAFVAMTATLVGDVTLGKNTSVWFSAVLRVHLSTPRSHTLPKSLWSTHEVAAQLQGHFTPFPTGWGHPHPR